MSTRVHVQALRRRMARAATRAVLRHPGIAAPGVASVPAADVRRVLVIRPNHRLGNLLLLTPLVQELQEALPNARIDIVLAGEDGPKLFRTFGNVDHIYVLSRRMVHHPLETARLAIHLRRAKYDLVIDPCPGSQSSRWLAVAAKATHFIGASGNDRPPDEPRVAGPFPIPRHMAKWPVHRLRQVVTPLDDPPDKAYPALDIRLSPAEHRQGQHILHVVTSTDVWLPPIIGVFADARGAKCYPKVWWMRFIQTVREQAAGFTVVEIAPPDGRSRLASHFPHFFSPDIREVAAVISQMTCFISADCGVMHLGCASGTPTIGLFSVTPAARYAPYGHGSCALDTNGKTPEQVARLVGRIIEEISAPSRSASPYAGTNPPRGESKVATVESQRPSGSNAKD